MSVTLAHYSVERRHASKWYRDLGGGGGVESSSKVRVRVARARPSSLWCVQSESPTAVFARLSILLGT